MPIFKYFRENLPQHSNTNAYLCSLASYYIYLGDRSTSVLGITGEARIREIFASLSVDDPFDITLYRGTSSPILPGQSLDTECALLVNSTLALVVFRGTEGMPIPGFNDNIGSSMQDWATNFQALLYSPPGYPTDASVHRGFYAALDSVYPRVYADLLAATQFNNNGKSVYVTGHSLGGALATLFAYRAFTSSPQTLVGGVYTFSAPRVGNTNFSLAYNLVPTTSGLPLQNGSWRWVYGNDPAPNIPPALPIPSVFTYTHTGTLNYAHSNGAVTAPVTTDPNENQGGLIPDGNHHSMTLLNRTIYRRLSNTARIDEFNPNYLTRNDVRSAIGIS